MEHQLISLFYQAEDYFFRTLSLQICDFDDEATGYLTGVQVGNLNSLVFKEKSTRVDNILSQAAQFYEIHKTPWNVVVPEMVMAKTMEQCLHKVKYAIVEKSVAMWLKLDEKENWQPKGYQDVRGVDDNLEDWQQPLIEAFESTPVICEQYRQAHERARQQKANFYHYSLYVDNKPVSSLTLSLNGMMARLDDIGTLPAHQNKGYATYLIQAALATAHKKGAKFCFLEASQYGFSVYQKIGFSSLFINCLAEKE